jgi:hypothetical protein
MAVDKAGRSKLRETDRSTKLESTDQKDRVRDRVKEIDKGGGSVSAKTSGGTRPGSRDGQRGSGAVKRDAEGSVKEQKEPRTEQERESGRGSRSIRSNSDALPATG